MKNNWWKVPLYTMIASWICFQLEIRLGRFCIITLPDGSITSDATRWMIMSFVLFAVIVIVGGKYFFRNMTRREIFYSASVLVVLNIILGVYVNKTQGMLAVYFAEFTEWNTFVNQILYRIVPNGWVSAAITWIVTPYIFVPFGKKG